MRHYTIHHDGSKTLRKVERDTVGKRISTKALGSNEVCDITSNYKYPEGSIAERAALQSGEKRLCCIIMICV